MSYFQERPAPAITDYHRKCEQHLRRTMASFDLAQRALANTDPESFALEYPGLFDNNQQTRHKLQRMQSVLIKSHFLLLKVELELFLHLLGLECWRVELLEFRAGKTELSEQAWKKLESPKPKDLLDHNDYVEALCATVVPRHGLGKITTSMKCVGTDLRGILSAQDRKIWPQVHTAFHVRHLIEHRNGYIDRQFCSIVASLWEESSWGSRIDDLDERNPITVTEEDLRATAEKMVGAVAALSDRCGQLAERRRALKDVPPQ